MSPVVLARIIVAHLTHGCLYFGCLMILLYCPIPSP